MFSARPFAKVTLPSAPASGLCRARSPCPWATVRSQASCCFMVLVPQITTRPFFPIDPSAIWPGDWLRKALSLPFYTRLHPRSVAMIGAGCSRKTKTPVFPGCFALSCLKSPLLYQLSHASENCGRNAILASRGHIVRQGRAPVRDAEQNGKAIKHPIYLRESVPDKAILTLRQGAVALDELLPRPVRL
jgi:hypothetical protein